MPATSARGAICKNGCASPVSLSGGQIWSVWWPNKQAAPLRLPPLRSRKRHKSQRTVFSSAGGGGHKAHFIEQLWTTTRPDARVAWLAAAEDCGGARLLG